MKTTIYHCLLLIGLQVHCCHPPGNQNDQDEQRNKSSHEHHHCQYSSSEDDRQRSPDYRKIVPSNSDFAFIFYKLIASEAAERNIFFSPLSISTAFALLTLGAKSETKDEILKAFAFNMSEVEEMEIHESFQHLLHISNNPHNKAEVIIGNALFLETSMKFLPKFLEDAKTLYEAEGFQTNFSVSRMARKQINSYVQNKTRGKIAHALDDLDPCTVMVLVNYIFFKAYWKNPFNTRFIREEDFFVDLNTTVRVNMMYRKGYYKYLHDEDLSCWVVEIPYNGDATSLFILPDQGKLEHVERALVKERLSKWMTSFKSNNIHLYIPKFSVSASYDIKDLLQRMGVTSVFHDSGDLSGITGERDLKVSKAVHKVVLDVNESGTEAVAVTTIEFMFRSASFHPTVTVMYNRPFLMIILHKLTNSILFLGKIVNPTTE